jgi:membrane peptidoglycan carboxypeptidase
VYRAQTGGGQQAVDSGTAFIVSEMLADDASRALIYGANGPLVLPGRHAAARVGTSENFHDGWTVGYTPSLSAAVWMGNANDAPMREGTDGIFVAAPAWHQFMTTALDRMHKGDEWYQMPSDVQSRHGFSGRAYFLTGTSPATTPPSLPDWAHLGVRDPGSGPYCRSWLVQTRQYTSCSREVSSLPGDPGPEQSALPTDG